MARITKKSQGKNKGTKVGFIGEGYVLESARKICDELGYSNGWYSDLNNLDCDVLFALRVKRIIPKNILDKISKGVVVIHYGKLPYYRGYYPINQAIRNGETEIGITMFYADEGVDTGDVIDQRIIKIDDNETVEQVYLRCDDVAISMFEDNLESVIGGTVERKKQTAGGSLFRENDLTRKLVLNVRDIKVLHSFIRSLTGRNQERAYIEDEQYRLYFEKTILVKKRSGDEIR